MAIISTEFKTIVDNDRQYGIGTIVKTEDDKLFKLCPCGTGEAIWIGINCNEYYHGPFKFMPRETMRLEDIKTSFGQVIQIVKEIKITVGI